MYLEHFLRSRDFLSQHGLNPTLKMGRPLSEKDLTAADAKAGVSMPAELRQFYLELGDGFQFIPDDDQELNLGSWAGMYLSDHVIVNEDFGLHVREEAIDRIPKAIVHPDLLRKEREKRCSWMPFFGFGCGGSYLCLDVTGDPPPVRVYNNSYWLTNPQTWSFVLASSFTEFVEKWSQYHFLTPLGDWLLFCRLREGTFDWAPEHFPQIETGG
jgi:hypothetical protein